jgi:hypothetical protein
LLDKNRSNELIIKELLKERDELIRKIRKEAQSRDDVLSKVLKKVVFGD